MLARSRPMREPSRPLGLIAFPLVALALGALALGAPSGPTLASSPPAQASSHFVLDAQVGGILGDVAAVSPDGPLLLGVGDRLVLLDPADPAAPRVLGVSEGLGGVVQDIAVAGLRAYVATRPSA